jgi:hypothetical protein
MPTQASTLWGKSSCVDDGADSGKGAEFEAGAVGAGALDLHALMKHRGGAQRRQRSRQQKQLTRQQSPNSTAKRASAHLVVNFLGVKNQQGRGVLLAQLRPGFCGGSGSCLWWCFTHCIQCQNRSRRLYFCDSPSIHSAAYRYPRPLTFFTASITMDSWPIHRAGSSLVWGFGERGKWGGV